jgi:Zn-dependent protease
MFNLLRQGYYLEAFLFIIAAVFSIIMHELAHGYAAIKNGDLTPRFAKRMTLNPAAHFDPIGFGLFLFVGFGWAKPVPVNPSNFNNYRKGMFQVAIAGVLLNFIFAFMAYPLMTLAFNAYYSSGNKVFEIFYILFSCVFEINLALCAFNLLPVYPLDGFRVLESRLRRINPYIDFMYKYGIFILIGMLLLVNYTAFDILAVMREIVGFPIMFFWSLFL